MIFDTGRSDLILPSSTCDSSCDRHVLYDSSGSPTAQDLKQAFKANASFDDSSDSFSGMLYTDTVTVAGYTVG